MERPGSRVGIADHNSKYSHYMNYKEIQQQMHHYHQQQQQNVNHYSDYEIYVPPIDGVPGDPTPRPIMRGQQQPQQRHISSPVGHRPQPERPNYYEYETAAAVLQAKQQLIQQQNNVNNNVLPQNNSSLTRRSKKYTKQTESHQTLQQPTGTSTQVPIVRQQPQPIYQTNQLKIYGSTYANGYSSTHSQAPPPQPTNPPPNHRIYDTINANNSNAIHDSNGYEIATKYQNVRPGSKV
ncbi:unnamed protein product [Medioppia subpectinata]|uniref:Ephrin RBD domain-containing protein n=1 Tax=Medioppia subpectinata TaxID=1979941 RepID=A0A7R9LDA4_9ACAR|nr:unnamed protein product [Medioppia subpectinata]CAG2117785.1 unnamed protein product [Medioppia subpectinata]